MRGTLCQLLLLLHLAAASPFDPHPLPARAPFVEGWFARLVDHSSNLSAALIVAAYSPGAAEGGFSAQKGETWAALLLQRPGPGEPPLTRQSLLHGRAGRVAVTKRGAPVARPPVAGAPAGFEYAAAQGRLNVSGAGGGSASLDFVDKKTGARIELRLSARVPYSRARPDTDGPEGWLPDPLLPTHYWVQSLASKAEYRITLPAEQAGEQGEHKRQVISGRGLAHFEANWGSTFPSGWVWVQAIADERTQLVLTGGNFTIAGISSAQWIVSLRSPKLPGGALDFRTIDLDRYTCPSRSTVAAAARSCALSCPVSLLLLIPPWTESSICRGLAFRRCNSMRHLP